MSCPAAVKSEGGPAANEESSFKEWILETIDQLRKRKARPDLERICHMLERRHGVAPLRTQTELERLVDDETVVKVDYKGNTSYRNAAKWGRRSSLNGQVLNSTDVSRLLVSTVRHLEAAAAASRSSAGGGGVGIGTIERHLLARSPHTTLVRTKLQVALERETVATTLLKLPNGNFTAFDKADPSVVPAPSTPDKGAQHSPPRDSPRPDAIVPTVTNINDVDNTNNNNNNNNDGVPPKDFERRPRGRRSKSLYSALVVRVVPKETAVVSPSPPPPLPPPPPPTTVVTKKGRPPNKRKRFKKTHGPDFVENYDSSFEEPEPKCDYCLLTAMCNCNGKPEELLFCKDCNAKAHPSCMDYSADLATRSRMSPWQCMDCKTCYVCDDSEDADLMLFCDSCDKGYHMGCHLPKLTTKPLGKWVCFLCSGSGKKPVRHSLPQKAEVDSNESNDNNDQPQTIDGALGLPTPCESPVPDAEQNKMLNFYFSKNSTLNDDKENVEVIPDASDWSIEEVESYFRKVGFADQASAFKEQEIDGKSLLLLKRSDVLTGLSIKLGPALKIYNYVKRLQTRRPDGHLMY